jgi:drug/metabolite transporter (DMT)-like permease
LVIGGAGLVALAAAVEGAPEIAWTPRFIAALAFLSLAGTAATTVVWFIEAGRSRLDILGAWTFLTPVFGILLSAAVLGEVPAGWLDGGRPGCGVGVDAGGAATGFQLGVRPSRA